jgi:TRAP-type mannitol/chloroaromatic compound transport system substrate-binding protein
MRRREFLRGVAAGMFGTTALGLGACAASVPPPTEQPASTPAPTAEQATATPPVAATSAPTAQAPVAIDAAQPEVSWRMATSWPVSFEVTYGGAQTIAERVAAMSDGRFTIKTFPAGEIVPALEVVQAVSQGVVESGHTPSYYYVGLDTALMFGTALPFGLSAQQQNAWLYFGGGTDLLRKVYAKLNVIQFPAGNSGTQMGGWFRKEINTVSDLQGLKMRIPGPGGQVMQRLGVTTQTLPLGETFQALQTGAIDAADVINPYDDVKVGMADAAEFYYYPGWWEPGPSIDCVVNLDAWNTLPKTYQEMLATAARQANIEMLARYEVLNSQALADLIAKGKTKLRPYSQEILEAARRSSLEIFDESAAANPLFKEIYTQWQSFRDRIGAWNAVNELSYFNFALPPATSG